MRNTSGPVGSITRGTTGTNRLRRIDRWITQLPAFRLATEPLVVDLGFGAAAATTLELHHRLTRIRADVQVIGLEIDPERVRLASASARDGVSFQLGGFEVPLARNRGATVIRVLNVLRQYDESAVLGAWKRMVSRLEPGGVLVEGTCSELGRIASWVDVDAAGPRTLTISLRLADLGSSADKNGPSLVAERLPKVLIHRNVAGERIHAFLLDLDRAWLLHAPLSVYSPSQRWIATAETLRATWPILGGRSRWKLGELTLDWSAVAPLGFTWAGCG